MAPPSADHTRHRSEPRLSANQLAKYMVTFGPGRIGIIRAARDSTTPPRARYSDLRNGLRAYLTDPQRDRSILTTLGNKLDQKLSDTSSSNFARQDAQSSLTALDAFLRGERNLLSGYNFTRAPARQTPLQIGGVEVNVQLDLLIQRERNGRAECGGALLRLTKADEDETDGAAGKRRDMASYAATLVQMQVRASQPDGTAIVPELCLSIDVQSGEVQPSSRNFLTRAQRLEAECRFISALWNEA